MVTPEARHWLKLANTSSQFRQQNFTILASEGWSTDSKVISDLPLALGSIGSFPNFVRKKQIVDHLQQLKLSQPGRNPWLERVYSEVYDCNASSPCRNLSLGDLHAKRSPYQRGRGDSSGGLSSYLPSAVDATFALAYAVGASIDELCTKRNCTVSSRKKLARKNLATSEGRNLFLRKLKSVDFLNPITGQRVAFTKEGNPIAEDYTFTNAQYKLMNDSKETSQLLEWVTRVAVYHPLESNDSSNTTCPANLASFVQVKKPVVYAGGLQKPPASTCSKQCGAHQWAEVTFQQRQMNTEGLPIPCCWTCMSCKENQYVNETFEGCLTCPPTARQNNSGTGCVDVSVWMWSNDLTPFNVYSVLAMMMMAFILLIGYLFHCKLGRQLNTLPLGGDLTKIGLCTIALSCCFIFVLSLKPSSVACGFIHFVWSVAIVIPFIPNLVYIASLLAVMTVLHRLGLCSISAIEGLQRTSKPQKQSAAVFPSRKLVLSSPEREARTLWIDLCYVMSTSRKRSLMSLTLTCVVIVLLAVISLVTDTSPVEEIKPHVYRRFWCSTSSVLFIAVFLLFAILTSTALLALVALRRMRAAQFNKLFKGTRFVLSNVTRSVITNIMIACTGLAIWRTLSGADKQMSALVIATLSLLATNFLTTYAVLLYRTWSHHRKSDSLSLRVLMDELVCAALETVQITNTEAVELASENFG